MKKIKIKYFIIKFNSQLIEINYNKLTVEK